MRVTGQQRRACLPLVVASIVLLPALAGCSSSSPSSSADSNYATGGPYPSQSLADLFKHASDPQPAQTASQPNCSTATAAGQPGVAPAASASASAAPCPSVAANTPPPPDDPVADYYHKVSLVDFFKNAFGSSTPAQPAPVPHPPSTYTPVSETYGTALPPVAPSPGSTAAAPAASPPPANLTGYPQQTPITAKPAAADAAASAPPADANPTASVYPQQSLVDLFFKKPASQ